MYSWKLKHVFVFIKTSNLDTTREVKSTIEAFCALSNIQITLNELTEAQVGFKGPNEKQTARVNAAANKALQYLQEIDCETKFLKKITAEHMKVLKFLATVNAEQIRALRFNEILLPMVDYTNDKGELEKGLNSAINS